LSAAMARMPMLRLLPNVEMPIMGFGVGTAWFRASGEKAEKLRNSVIAALDAGFRHLDDAEMYGNEKPFGDGVHEWLARTGADRSQLFITGKVYSCDEPGPAAVCRSSLAASRLPYYDLYLVHSPFQRGGEPFRRSLLDIWREVETLVDDGLVKAVGVSNWRIEDLASVIDGARIKPVCNQVEAHPHLQQTALVEWCSAHGITVTAYSPLVPLRADCAPLVDGAVTEVAKKHGRTTGQVLLRWNMQTGRGVITTSSRADRMKEYLDSFDFELDQADVDRISQAGAAKHLRMYWSECPQFARL